MADATPGKDDTKALDQVFAHLKAKDDTSRFVGLSLLRTILDSNEDLRNDDTIIKKCWAAVPNKFLIRLLKPVAGGCSASSMKDLAVAVVHTFANLLPTEDIGNKKLLELVEPLMKVLPVLSSAPQMLAFQTLQCIVSSAAGAHVFARASCHKEIVAIFASREERFLREFLKLYDLGWRVAHDVELKSFLGNTIRDALVSQQESSILLETLSTMGSQLAISDEYPILEIMVKLIHNAITKKPTAQARIAATKLASEVVQRCPPNSNITNDLFQGPKSATEDKPFAYIFVQYVLIDIRSSIPALMTNLASPTYQNESLRLAAGYDVVTGFVTYLMSIMNDDEDITENSQASPIPPDLLLKLRRDFSETFSLTLEYFRDRWDAVISGASGLDPSARIDPKAPPMLAWDNPTIPPEEDPIILSGLRALSLWLREDDNEQLVRQTLSIADMLAALYESSMKPGSRADFRSPILVLLQALMLSSSEAVQLFLDNKGWEILSTDLKQAVISHAGFIRVRDIVCVLHTVVTTTSVVPQSREAWMDIVRLAADLDTKTEDGEVLESIAEVYQLADAIYENTPKRLRYMFEVEANEIAKSARGLAKRLKEQDADQGLIDSFEELEVSLKS